MYSFAQVALRFIKYYLVASNGKGHGIHSPFVFEFVTKVLNDNREFYAYRQIENMRKLLGADPRTLTVEDMGAGSRTQRTSLRSVRAMARSSVKPAKFSQLLFRIVHYYQPKNILELGTSLGITTSYMASAGDVHVTTIEGAKEVAGIAKEVFTKLKVHNIRQVTGNFDDVLLPTIKGMHTIDLCFIDGNHRYEPTVRYYHTLLPYLNEYSILIFDDIHWSDEMEKAWETIGAQPDVTLTIDLFYIGIVFFRKENRQKEHFTIRF